MARFATLVSKAILPALMAGSILLPLSFAGCAGSGVYAGAEVDYTSGDYGYLSRYGQWEDYAPYGRIWRPWVAADWQPFEYGNWEWDGSDWAWVSYEPYGDIVYHYGNWDYDADFGWFWIPGNTWSPARVQWMRYGDYACWAPLPPAHVKWGDPWDQRSARVWNVVRVKDLTQENIAKYRIPAAPQDVRDRSTIVRRQPSIRIVEQATQRPVTRVNINIEKTRPAPGQFRRTVLPPPVNERVQRNRPQVEQEVIHPGPLQPIPPERARGQQRGRPDNRPAGKGPKK